MRGMLNSLVSDWAFEKTLKMAITLKRKVKIELDLGFYVRNKCKQLIIQFNFHASSNFEILHKTEILDHYCMDYYFVQKD